MWSLELVDAVAEAGHAIVRGDGDGAKAQVAERHFGRALDVRQVGEPGEAEIGDQLLAVEVLRVARLIIAAEGPSGIR